MEPAASHRTVRIGWRLDAATAAAAVAARWRRSSSLVRAAVAKEQDFISSAAFKKKGEIFRSRNRSEAGQSGVETGDDTAGVNTLSMRGASASHTVATHSAATSPVNTSIV